MDCREASIQIGAWVDGEDTPGIAEHVKSCNACSKEAEFLRALKKEIRSLPRPKAPAALLKKRRALPRWIPAAAAAAILVSVIMLALPSTSSGLPDLVVKSSAFFDGILAGKIKPEECSTPAELRDYFRAKLGVRIDAPELPDCAIMGGCPCDIADTTSPWIVYKQKDEILALLVFKGKLPDLPDDARRNRGDKEYFAFSCGKNTIILCATGETAHLWIARAKEERMVATILATPEGRSALEGARISVGQVT